MKEKSGPMKAINTLIVILFVSAMVGMVYFSQTRPPICVFIVGAVFFFMGILGIFTNGLTLENSFLLIFPFSGAIVMLISASFIWSFSILEKILENIEYVIPIALIVSFFCIGVYRYYYNGCEYTYKSNFSSNVKPPVLNEYYEIKINPKHPEEAWISQNSITLTILGIIFMMLSILISFCWLKQISVF